MQQFINTPRWLIQNARLHRELESTNYAIVSQITMRIEMVSLAKLSHCESLGINSSLVVSMVSIRMCFVLYEVNA
jgi:hypothetical protein